MRDLKRAVLRPSPIGAGVERLGERSDLLFLFRFPIEIHAGGEKAGQEKGCVDGGQFRARRAATGLHIEKVIIKTPIAGRVGRFALLAVPEKTQRHEGPLDGFGARQVSSLDADGISREREPDGGDAGGRVLLGAIRHHSVFEVGLFQKIPERGLLQVGQFILA